MERQQRDIKRKLAVLEYANEFGNVAQTAGTSGSYDSASTADGAPNSVMSTGTSRTGVSGTPPSSRRAPISTARSSARPLADKLDFSQLLEYTDDVDLPEKLAVWEEFSNVHGLHNGLGEVTLYAVLPSGRRWHHRMGEVGKAPRSPDADRASE